MKIKKLLLLMAAILLFVAGCSNDKSDDSKSGSEDNTDNLTESGMPIVEDSISLDIFVNKAATTADDWNDIMIFNEYKDMTNIDVNWEMVPVEGMKEKRNLALASGSLPDAFWGTAMPQSDLLKYGKQGVFLELDDLIDNHAPNLKKFLEENPDMKKGITMSDGHIYALPRYYEPDFTSVHLGPRLWIREDWLKALDMDMPETTDEFYQYLQAVKEENPSGSEDINEIPYGGTSVNTLKNALKGSFGLGTRGNKHPNIDINPDNEELRFIPTTDEYKELLEYLHKLYSDKLIEQNIFSIEAGQYIANATEGLYGSTVYHSPDMLFGEEIGNKFTSGEVLEGPHGDRMYSSMTSSVAGTGNFVITEENENPEATMRWVDYFYGEEGAKFYFMGIEGETFEETADGEYEYLDKFKHDEDGLSMEQALAKYLTYPGGGSPSIIMEKYFKGSETTDMSLEAADKIEPYVIEEVWPAFAYTEEESKEKEAFGTDIDKYVDEMSDKFISGDASFSEWDKYVETLESMGLDKYMEIEAAAYERYEEN